MRPTHRRLAGVLTVLLLVAPQTMANPLKAQIEALYRPVDGRLLKLRTLLPPRREAQAEAQDTEQPGGGGGRCPEKILIGSQEQDRRGRVRTFAPKIYVDGPIVIRCGR